MDKVTLTFLNALADMLGILPQKPNQTVSQQKNRSGITSAQSQGKVTSSQQRGLRSQNSTANVTRQPPSDIVRSPGGQLAKTQPPGALATRPSSALTTRMSGPSSAYTPDPFAGSATVPPQQGGGSARGNLLSPGAQPNQTPRPAGPVDANPMRGLSPASRNAVPQSAGGNAKRLGPLAGLAEIAGQFLTDELVGKPLSELIYGMAAQQPGTAASMGLRDEDGGTGYGGGHLTRFADPIGPQPTAAGNAARANAQPQQPAAEPPTGPRQVQYPTAAEMQANAVDPVVEQAPGPVATLETPKARDWRDTMYMEARSKAMNIADPVQRQVALEGVAQMGMEFHKDYYGQ